LARVKYNNRDAPITKCTDKQKTILRSIQSYPATVRAISLLVVMTTDQVQSSIRRMEDNNWVRRLDSNPPTRWELTRQGRDLLG
jgi:hypothetical protein